MYTNSLVNVDLFYTNFTNTTFQKEPSNRLWPFLIVSVNLFVTAVYKVTLLPGQIGISQCKWVKGRSVPDLLQDRTFGIMEKFSWLSKNIAWINIFLCKSDYNPSFRVAGCWTLVVTLTTLQGVVPYILYIFRIGNLRCHYKIWPTLAALESNSIPKPPFIVSESYKLQRNGPKVRSTHWCQILYNPYLY